MRQLWLVALLTVLPFSLWAQEFNPVSGTGVTGQTLVQPAFDLLVDAPDEVRQLLERHLELMHYRDQTDLADSELERLLISARQDVLKLLATLGYFSPNIRIERVLPEAVPSVRRIKITVAPGEPTLVTEVHISFNGSIASDPQAALQRQHISDNWLLRTGMRFSQTQWSDAKQQALRTLTTQRYPSGQISVTLADIDPLTHSARLSLTLESGASYRMGELVVSGLKRYATALVQQLARLTPGTIYSQEALVAAQQRLADSGYFDSAFLSLDTAGDPAAAPVLVTLREAMLQKMVLGIGVSTDSGPRVSLEHTHHKVPGLGWRAVSKLTLDRETRAIGSELTAPPDVDNWRWVTSGLLQNQQLGSAEVTSQRLRFGRNQNGDRIDRTFYLQYDRADTVDTDVAQPVNAQAVSANYAFTVRNFDQLPFPSSGWGWGVEVGGGATLGSQRDVYARLLTRVQSFWPLGATAEAPALVSRFGRIAARASVGAVVAKEGISLPSTQLFLTGGDNSVRGYGLRDIGVTLANGQTTAGRYLAVGSVEWQRPIRINGQLSDWESTLFLDAGAVVDQVADLQAKLGVGAGVRWNSPVGPLQIDLAYGVAVQRFRLHMNVGFTF
jgi:translocation and assembly module TamA